MSKIILAGFEAETAKKLSQMLINLKHQTESLSCDPGVVGTKHVDLVFLSGDDVRFRRSLISLRNNLPTTPVIVASRTGEDSLWLAALEAGATDYCSVDVDSANLAWMLSNALDGTKPPLRALAGAA